MSRIAIVILDRHDDAGQVVQDAFVATCRRFDRIDRIDRIDQAAGSCRARPVVTLTVELVEGHETSQD